jgi:phage tail sheath protein FI
MLAQCKKLQDRFAIFDLIESIGSEMPSSLDGIRERFGNNDLKYAAAYFPGLQTNYTYRIGYDEIVKEGAVVKDGEPAFKVTDLFIESLYNAITAAALDEEKQEAIDTLCEIDPVYQAIADACEKETRALPPGGAIAGVYASVDRDRGVWKAPANVSLSSVIGPVFNLTDAENGELNVDSGTGKSINAIRAFTGKGTMVWGARTLAGNDNEWRYIPVRRFFIMVEESVKKATEQFVFEPNDANTWVKVRAMIENFLTLQWRAGALAGAKPEQAFYVRVGLGQTMTSQDILEGRMNIEIGMAAVRPAEFIILKFSHKMQEA